MNVFFRADANNSIGMGHVMRCLSIADAFRLSSGIESAGIKFILADNTVEELIHSRGYETIVLNISFNDMDEEIELWEFRAWTTIDILIVDSYFVTPSYLIALKERVGKLVYIDDVLTFPYPVDILINYNAYAKADSYEALYKEASDTPDLILGPTYAPLRSMFRELPRKIQSRTVQNILISTGGSDELHVTVSLLQRLSRGEGQQSGSSSTNPVYHFLIGAMNEDKHEIQTLAESPGLSGRVMIHQNVTDMKGLIVDMDLAVSAAGSTLYEISACGVPLITYSLADNQLPGAAAFRKLGMALDVGDLRDPKTIDQDAVMSGNLDLSSVNRIMVAVANLSSDYNLRVQMGKRMQELIDGYGANRMVERLIK